MSRPGPELRALLARMAGDGLITLRGSGVEKVPGMRSYGREALAILLTVEQAETVGDDAARRLHRAGVPVEFHGHASIVGRCGECGAEAWAWPGHPATLTHTDRCPVQRLTQGAEYGRV